MKKIIDNSKKGLYSLWYGVVAMLFILSCYSCEKDNLDIQEVFPFEVKVMPVPKEIETGATVEMRFSILSNGEYAGNTYFLRYFQNDGKGILRYFDHKPYLPNDIYALAEKEFRLYYTSQSTVSQQIDIWIVDSFGNEKQLVFQFNNKKPDMILEPIRDN